MPAAFWGDLKGLFSSRSNLLLLAGGLAAGEIGDAVGVDDSINEEFREERDLDLEPWLNDSLQFAGDGGVLVGLAVGIWGAGHVFADPETHRAGSRAVASLATTGFVTQVLKNTISESRPRGGPGSFPSGHTSMSFAFADSMQQSYGLAAGIPLYVLSTGVALQRLDSGAHEFEDIMFGAALGIAVSRTVHRRRNGAGALTGVAPFLSAEDGAVGLTFSFDF